MVVDGTKEVLNFRVSEVERKKFGLAFGIRVLRVQVGPVDFLGLCDVLSVRGRITDGQDAYSQLKKGVFGILLAG